ncbi:MAG: OpgC family protein [Elsteraceae bacterium]
MPTVPLADRDHRIDFFRGVALIAIFIDHIPENLFALLTTRNLGFSDASEIFIFLSGFSAAMVFTQRRATRGWVFASLEALRRVWTLYIVHIFVFVLFIAQVALTAQTFSNPMYVDEMKIGDFLAEPHVAVVEALLLRFQPRFLDILPLYIALLLTTPALLAVPARYAWITLAASFALYLAVPAFGLRPLAYPDDREWTFNPVAWQFLFVIGVYLGRGDRDKPIALPRARWLLIPVFAYLCFGAVVQISWTIAGLYPNFPALLSDQLWPLDKTNLSAWRLSHFLCLAYVIARLTRPDHRFFRGPVARPLVLCGRHSLNIFCLGIFLSFFGHLIQTEISAALWTQAAIVFGGAGLMFGLATLQSWYKNLSRAPSGNSRPVGRGDGSG